MFKNQQMNNPYEKGLHDADATTVPPKLHIRAVLHVPLVVLAPHAIIFQGSSH